MCMIRVTNRKKLINIKNAHSRHTSRMNFGNKTFNFFLLEKKEKVFRVETTITIIVKVESEAVGSDQLKNPIIYQNKT